MLGHPQLGDPRHFPLSINGSSADYQEALPLVPENHQNNNPKGTTCSLGSAVKTISITLKDAAVAVAVPGLDGALAAYSGYFFLQEIISGVPQYAQAVLVPAVKYGIPSVAVALGTESVMNYRKFPYFTIPRAGMSAAVAGLGLATFLDQFTFFVVSEVITATSDTDGPVYISNGAAITIITSCTAVGALQALRMYFVEKAQKSGQAINDVPQSGVSRVLFAVSNNGVSRVVLSTLDSASGFHAFFGVVENLFGLRGDIGDIVRYTATGVGAGAGFLAGLPQNPYQNKFSRPYEGIMKLVKLTSFCFAAYELFNGPNSEAFFGEETLEEQQDFWPIFILYIVALQTLGFAGPKLWELASTFIAHWCLTDRDENDFVVVVEDGNNADTKDEPNLGGSQHDDSTLLQFDMDDLEAGNPDDDHQDEGEGFSVPKIVVLEENPQDKDSHAVVQKEHSDSYDALRSIGFMAVKHAPLPSAGSWPQSFQPSERNAYSPNS